jgi:glycosyltransferase involved in cell wall biosynthesis
MSIVHLLPIEPIEERYSADWRRWWPRALRAEGLDVQVIEGTSMHGAGRGDAIRHGQFLDAIDTHYYKATQLAVAMHTLSRGQIRAGDAVVFLDGWNAAVEAFAYARQVAKIDFAIVLALHAGCWDPHDHLTQCALAPWARHAERAWLTAADRVLVATEFHRQLIEAYHGEAVDLRDRICVTGFPLELDELDQYRGERQPIVVFPHRLAPEKRPELFQDIQAAYCDRYREALTPAIKWVRTQDGYTDKAAFYRLLGSASVALSTAWQETWGIAQLEAWYLGATPVVPDRLAYAELYPSSARYNTVDEAVQLVHDGLHAPPLPFAPARDPRRAWRPIAESIRGVLR